MAMTDASRVKFARTPVLSIGYEEHGDASGFPIILLHGFPYDIRSFDGVLPPLVEAGYRVLVPYLRGYRATRFLDPQAPVWRSRPPSARTWWTFLKHCA